MHNELGSKRAPNLNKYAPKGMFAIKRTAQFGVRMGVTFVTSYVASGHMCVPICMQVCNNFIQWPLAKFSGVFPVPGGQAEEASKNWMLCRVTRLGEFSPIGPLLT
jgi:hypothetical protein